MAIPISTVKQRCCDNDLSAFTVIDGDSLHPNDPTCDKIIECGSKYILVEEKSLILRFCTLCCQEVGHDLESYKYENGGTTYLRLTDIISLIHTISIDIKKRILAEMVSSMLNTSMSKVSNTTYILSTDPRFDPTKAKGMKPLYLYCNSGKPIDMVMALWLSRDRKTPFIECTALKDKLMEECS